MTDVTRQTLILHQLIDGELNPELAKIMLLYRYRTRDIIPQDVTIHTDWYHSQYMPPDVHEMGKIQLNNATGMFDVVRALKPELLNVQLTVSRRLTEEDLDSLNPTNLETLSVFGNPGTFDMSLFLNPRLPRLPLHHITLTKHLDNQIDTISSRTFNLYLQAFENRTYFSANISFFFNQRDFQNLQLRNERDGDVLPHYTAVKNSFSSVSRYFQRSYDMRQNSMLQVQSIEPEDDHYHAKLQKNQVELDFVLSRVGFHIIVNCNKTNNISLGDGDG